MKLDKLKTLLQSCNLNFLIGSGCSVPFLGALGQVEILLTKYARHEPHLVSLGSLNYICKIIKSRKNGNEQGT